jgi:VanZ family protein
MVVAVVWLSLTPSPPHIDIDSGDKLGHVLSYFLLMFWFAQLYARRAGYAAGFIAMGITLELLQGALGYRSFERYDILANCAGVLLGWAAAHLVGRRLLA